MAKETKLYEVEKYSKWREDRELFENENDTDDEEEKGSVVVIKIELPTNVSLFYINFANSKLFLQFCTPFTVL